MANNKPHVLSRACDAVVDKLFFRREKHEAEEAVNRHRQELAKLGKALNEYADLNRRLGGAMVKLKEPSNVE